VFGIKVKYVILCMIKKQSSIKFFFLFYVLEWFYFIFTTKLLFSILSQFTYTICNTNMDFTRTQILKLTKIISQDDLVKIDQN
jgi:hypothetical protein